MNNNYDQHVLISYDKYEKIKETADTMQVVSRILFTEFESDTEKVAAIKAAIGINEEGE